ncbi:MAG: N-acetylmuramoyl-L-alanine amidase [Elusimicrobia bacterium]|nr:N-acetylmuramoyl-L-alanine amidase [Elusimicrobiota bacterium]
MSPVLACLALAAASFAHEPGVMITFAGAPAARKFTVHPLSQPGEVVHDFGVSDPVPAAYDSLLFQGRTVPGVTFEASVDDKDQGPWASAAVEVFPNGRFWGKFALQGRKGSTVRLRVVHQGARASSVIEVYELEAYRARREAEPVSPKKVEASTDAVKPEVESREGWNAAPPKYEYTPMAPARMTIHHTAGASAFTLEDARVEMRLIQRYHQAGRGWNDIGYHFVIDGSGRVFQGRPETVVGAHVLNHNTGNVGVSFMGNYHPPVNAQPSAAQLGAFLGLARWLVAAYSIDPRALLGHRDQQATDCPGDNLYARVDELRRALQEPVPPPGPSPKAAIKGLPDILGGVDPAAPFAGR